MVNHLDLLLELWVGDVDHMNQQVGVADLVEGRLERLHKVGGELADESHGVGQQEREIVDGDFAHGGVECGEKLVLGKDVALAQQVHQCGFSYVGVAHQGHAGEFAAVFALDGLLAVDVGQLLLEPGYAALDDASVGLDLCLARASHADTALLTLEVGPHSCQSREQILILRQLHLRLGRGGLCAAGEDVEDQARTVENLHLQFFLDVGNLLGGEVVVENHHPYVVFLDIFLDFSQFALPHECAGIGLFEFLHKACDNLGSGRVGQKLKLVEIFVHLVLGLPGCDKSHGHGPFGGFF